MAVLRLIRTIDTIAIKLPGPRFRQIAMPDAIGLLGQLDSLQFAPAARVEQTQLNLARVLREQREVHSLAIPGRPQWIGPPRPYCGDGCHRREKRLEVSG